MATASEIVATVRQPQKLHRHRQSSPQAVPATPHPSSAAPASIKYR